MLFLSKEQQLAINIAAPFQLMKFTLTFEGNLPTSGNKPKPEAVWRIRRTLHPQIADLFLTHPVLTEVVPDKAYFPDINVKGFDFTPVVRRRLNMICSLNIIFLRKMEAAGLVHQGGDLDNRIKTLFDGLRMPDKGDEVPEKEVRFEPMNTLLESDGLITNFSIKADKLLDGESKSKHWVKLLIEAHVSVTRVTMGNVSFLGD
jgi:hypothetical protein